MGFLKMQPRNLFFRLIQEFMATSIFGIVAVLVLPIAVQVGPAHAAEENTAKVIEFLIEQIFVPGKVGYRASEL